MREAREGITWQADVLEGQADGRPPLVLLHGPAFDRSTWQPALAELCVADPGRQVLALDLPGHGDSPPLRRYDIDSVLAAVHEAVRWTRLDSPVVVGHAMAAVIATAYAARYPARGIVNVNQWLRAEPPEAPGTWVADEIRGGGFAAEGRPSADGWQLPCRPDVPGWCRGPALRSFPAAATCRTWTARSGSPPAWPPWAGGPVPHDLPRPSADPATEGRRRA